MQVYNTFQRDDHPPFKMEVLIRYRPDGRLNGFGSLCGFKGNGRFTLKFITKPHSIIQFASPEFGIINEGGNNFIKGNLFFGNQGIHRRRFISKLAIVSVLSKGGFPVLTI